MSATAKLQRNVSTLCLLVRTLNFEHSPPVGDATAALMRTTGPCQRLLSSASSPIGQPGCREDRRLCPVAPVPRSELWNLQYHASAPTK